MTDSTTISWIFLAIALSSVKTPVGFKEILEVADGINHAVPTPREFQDSISWLSDKNLIEQVGNKYSYLI